VRLREKIRADRGPTVVFGEAERGKLAAIHAGRPPGLVSPASES